MPWILAIDFGTTSTSVATCVNGRVELVEIDGAPRMPSMVFWREGTGGQTGRLMIGAEAENMANKAPWALERTPKRRLGDEYILLGEQEVRVVDAVAAILRIASAEAIRRRGGESPSETRLTYPARWGGERLGKLRTAAKSAGLDDPVFIPEPVAAATHFASERLEPGQHVAVYDLGGGTFDTAVLRRTDEVSFEVVGSPGGREDLGGEDFDDRLYRHLGGQLEPEQWAALCSSEENAWRQANLHLMREARKAKETLSKSPDYDVYIPPPVDVELHVTDAEFQQLILEDIEGTVSELERTILAAGLDPAKLAGIYLAGGSSRIPLVARMIEERLGQPPDYLDDPKSVIALGAARATEAPTGAPAAAGKTLLGEPEPPSAGGETVLASPAGAGEADEVLTAAGETVLDSAADAGEEAVASAGETVLEGSAAAGATRIESAAPAPAAVRGTGGPEAEAPSASARAEGARAGARRGGRSGRLRAAIGAAVVIVAGVVAAVVISGGSAATVSEAQAKELTTKFQEEWNAGNTTNLSELLTSGVTLTYPGQSGSETVSGREQVLSAIQGHFFSGGTAGSHGMQFSSPSVRNDSQGTYVTGDYTSGSEDIPGPGTFTFRFAASDPASAASSQCHSGACIKQLTFATR